MSTSFAQWLRQGHTNLRGTIQQPNLRGRYGHIRPDDFPEERLFFKTPPGWSGLPPQNSPVLFDLEPQPNWNPTHTARAINVRLVRDVAA